MSDQPNGPRGAAVSMPTREDVEEALRLLLEVTAAASEAPDLEAMTTLCLERICAMKGWEIAQAWFIDEHDGVLVCSPRCFYAVVDVGEFRRASVETRMPRGVGLPGRCWEALAPVWLSDPPTASNFPRASYAQHAGLRAAFAFPIRNGDRVFAIFEFFSTALRDPSPSFLAMIDTLGSHLAIVFERRRAEEARARLAEIVEASPDIIAACDPSERMVYINRAGRRLLGIGPDEALGELRVADLYTPESYQVLRDEIIPVALREGVWRGDHPLRRRDGAPVPCSHVLISHHGRGGLEWLACIGRDMTERRRLEEEFRQAQKMEAVGRLAGGVAHDFNNLLTTIMCAAQYVIEAFPAGDPRRSALSDVLAASERGASLTRQLLTFSRREVVAPRVLDLNALVARDEPMLRRLLGEDVALKITLGEGVGRIKADPGQVAQVVMNLAVNARQAMPRGGTLSVETRAVARGPTGAPWALLAVADTGCGMDAATRSHLFEPFFTTKPPGEGTGLGLSTVYGIVRQCGGEIEVYSEPGRGATFEVYLPTCDEPLSPGSSPPKRGATGRGSETVLLVEDAEGVRRTLRQLLEGAGYTVVEAANAAEALAVTGRGSARVDLVITDVVMPGMSGPELVAALTPRMPGVRVLYMSGYVDRARRGVELAPGSHFIGKPFSFDDLAAKLREVLDAPRS